jgi:hypothetical protein
MTYWKVLNNLISLHKRGIAAGKRNIKRIALVSKVITLEPKFIFHIDIILNCDKKNK